MDILLQKTPSTDNPEAARVDPNYLDYYRIFRGQIEHEDNLVGSRISWFVTSQSFLFSAYAIIAGGIQPNSSKTGLDAKHVLLVIIPSVAIVTSVLMWVSIFAGFAAMRLVRKHCEQLTQPPDPLLPPVHGSAWIRRAGMAAPALLPPIFMAVWIFLLMRRLF